MTDLLQLNDVEIAAVAGGAISQSASVTATQSNSSSVSQTASASNSGAVSATNGAGSGNTAAAAGAEASNLRWSHRSTWLGQQQPPHPPLNPPLKTTAASGLTGTADQPHLLIGGKPCKFPLESVLPVTDQPNKVMNTDD